MTSGRLRGYRGILCVWALSRPYFCPLLRLSLRQSGALHAIGITLEGTRIASGLDVADEDGTLALTGRYDALNILLPGSVLPSHKCSVIFYKWNSKESSAVWRQPISKINRISSILPSALPCYLSSSFSGLRFMRQPRPTCLCRLLSIWCLSHRGWQLWVLLPPLFLTILSRLSGWRCSQNNRWWSFLGCDRSGSRRATPHCLQF